MVWSCEARNKEVATSRLVGFTTHKLELGQSEHGPEWLEIRDTLSYVERQKLNSALLDIDVSTTGDTNMKADPGRYRPAMLLAYVTGWQLFDDTGQVIPFGPDTLARLNNETAEEAIAHIDAMVVEQDSQKKAIAPPASIIEGRVKTK